MPKCCMTNPMIINCAVSWDRGWKCEVEVTREIKSHLWYNIFLINLVNNIIKPGTEIIWPNLTYEWTEIDTLRSTCRDTSSLNDRPFIVIWTSYANIKFIIITDFWTFEFKVNKVFSIVSIRISRSEFELMHKFIDHDRWSITIYWVLVRRF